MLIKLRQPRSINDLEAFLKSNPRHRDQLSLRRSVPIGVIDDEEFAAYQNLKSNHYNVTYLGDIDSISRAEPFAIILCDLFGVGSKLSKSQQGALIISEIRKHYPEKVIIAYTGGHKSAGVVRKAEQSADTFLRKDADLDEWITVLDEYIKKVTDPVEVWKSFRLTLLKEGLPPKELMEIEDEFVRAYERGNESASTNIVNVINRADVSQHLKAIMQSFVASVVFKLIFS